MKQIEHAFTAAATARKAFEDAPSDKNRAAFYDARAAYRLEVIGVMRGRTAQAIDAYNALAAPLAVVFEELAQLEKFFKEAGIDSPLATDFVKSIRLPVANHRGQNFVCGRQADPMRFPFEDTFSAAGQAMWDDTYRHYPPKDVIPKEASFDVGTIYREADGPLGNVRV